MYKTTEVYEVGTQNAVEVNIAAIEKMVDTQNAKNTITVVHMFGELNIVLNELTARYKLPRNISLYQVGEIERNPFINSFEELKKYGFTHVQFSKELLFMYNKDNGMWTNRLPNYDDASMLRQRIVSHPIQTERSLVPEMLKEVQEMPDYMYKTYIREAGEVYEPKYATIYQSFYEDEFKAGNAYFAEKFKLAKTQATNKKCIMR